MIANLPIFVTFLGIIIHTLGLLNFIPNPGFVSDISMLIVDTLVFYGLIKQTRFGYFAAVVLYLQQSIMQPYWAYSKYINNYFILDKIELLIGPFLVILSLILLITNRSQYFRKKT